MSIIKIKNLWKSFGELLVLKNISLDVEEKERILITGPNGSGKTTLLRCIAMLEEIDKGTIILNGYKITPRTSRETKENLMKQQIVGFVFQELYPWPHLTVLENLTKPLVVVKKLDEKKAKKIASGVLHQVGLYEKREQYPSFLSGGQKRRLIIARTLIMNPKILLLDEITANLDIKLKREIYSLVKKISKDKTMIIASHDVKLLRGFVDKIYNLEKGVLKLKQ